MTAPTSSDSIAGGPFARFVQGGVREATRRLSMLVDQPRPDETALVRLLASSRLVRVIAGLFAAVLAAARTSVAIATARRVAGLWAALGAPARRRLGGVALVTSALTHVAMVWAHAAPPGWIWLILPGLAVAIGTLLLLASGRSQVGTRG